MSDNFKRYNCIKSGLRQLLPKGLSAYELRMLDHLAKLINGNIGAGNCQLPKIAAKDPRPIKTESKISTLKRLLLKTEFSPELFWLPFVRQFLEGLAKSRKEFVLVMDGSEVGRGCMALVMNIVYAGRALPIGWLVVEGNKGHLSEKLHLQLLEQVHALVPDGVKVVFLGDGEFDGTWLQETVRQYGWNWVVRTAKNSQYITPKSKQWHNFRDWPLKRGQMVVRQRIGFSWEGWGPVTGIGVWDKEYKEPIYLISSFKQAETALGYYKKRFRIEIVCTQ